MGHAVISIKKNLALDGGSLTVQFFYTPEKAFLYPSYKELGEIQGPFGHSDESRILAAALRSLLVYSSIFRQLTSNW
jgi:hypothetical protein